MFFLSLSFSLFLALFLFFLTLLLPFLYNPFNLFPTPSHRSLPLCTEIPRVIAAQQQNTAPEVQQYDADPYQPDSDTAANNGRKISRTEFDLLLFIKHTH